MKWPEDLAGWPMGDVSRKVLCRPHRWHVQEAGTGETLLLLHGAGGATQSWRGLFPLLTKTHHVIALDLPGQGFTELGARSRCGLVHMAEDVASLMDQESWSPAAVIGHSAGGAIALQLGLLGKAPKVIGINAALSNFRGVAGWLFPFMAKALAINPLTSRLFSATATPSSVRNLISGTGSKLDAEGEALYVKLIRDSGHVDATLAMMSQWSLDLLNERLPELQIPVDLITGDLDKAVPPKSSADAVALLPNAQLHTVAGLGHLAHEEDPERVAELILSLL